MSINGMTLEAMQTVRVLPAEDFSLLAQAPDSLIPNGQFVTVVVAEREGKLLGRRFLCLVPHIEGAWQLPECNVPALEHALAERIAAMGVTGAMRASGPNEDLTAEGYEMLPLLLWVKRPAEVTLAGSA